MTDTNSTEARLDALESKLAISEVLFRYCRALDRLDETALQEIFWQDAMVDYGPGIYNGPVTDFVPFAMQFQGAMKVTQHRVSNVLIDLDGDTAYCDSQMYAFHVLQSADELVDLIVIARMGDRFERRNGEWRIADRIEVIDWAHERPSTDDWFERQPELHRGRHDSTDPAYQRIKAFADRK